MATPHVPPDELLEYARSKLKKTQTRVTDNLGRTHYEEVGEDGMLTKSGYTYEQNLDDCYARLKPYLLVGSEDLATAKEKLQSLGVTHIINLATYVPNKFPEDFEYLRIEIYDMPDMDLMKHFEKIIDFIEAARSSNGSVYVHCNAGISRAPSSCMAYLMWKDQVKRITAYDYIRGRRWVMPNPGFMSQLEKFEAKLGLESSTNTVNPAQ